MAMRPAGALPLHVLLYILIWASSHHDLAFGEQDSAEAHSIQLSEAHSHKERMAATPAYVISGVNERWEHSRSVLAMLHIPAERVWPPKPSLHHAKELYATYGFDRQANMTDKYHQKVMSLLAAWRQVLGHIAHHPDLAPDEWALALEDDISLHDDLTLAAARAAILRGFSLARADGWLYLGVCLAKGDGQVCWEDTTVVVDSLQYAKCIGLCSHALAFTKRKAGTMLADLRAGMKRFTDAYGHYPNGHSIDQMLKQLAIEQNGTWTAGTNFKVGGLPPYDDTNRGLLFQDRDVFTTTISKRRMMRATGGV